jgi:hypothetical protein
LLLVSRRPLPKFPAGRVIMALGFAWWLLLSPSIVGLSAVVVGIWIALREREPQRVSTGAARIGY